jgi:hypothetical protein
MYEIIIGNLTDYVFVLWKIPDSFNKIYLYQIGFSYATLDTNGLYEYSTQIP